MKAWDIFEPNNPEPLDTVVWVDIATAWEVRWSLINDGMPEHIWIVCEETEEDSRDDA